jgi:Holliday junction resolvase
MPISPKGTRRERELLEKMVKENYVVHRIAGSGLGREAICDLIAVKSGEVLFIECKSKKKAYYSKEHREQFEKLIKAAKKAGAKPVLAVKLNYKDWQFFDLRKGIPVKVE